MIVTDFQFLKSFRCAFENISSMVFFFLVHGIVDDKTGTCIKSFKSFIVDSVLISRKNVKIIKFKNFTFSRPLNLNEYPIYPETQKTFLNFKLLYNFLLLFASHIK